jgi:hypothetical protein
MGGLLEAARSTHNERGQQLQGLENVIAVLRAEKEQEAIAARTA